MIKLLLGLFLCAAIVGCNQDPYPEIKNTGEGGRNPNEADPVRDVKEPLALAVDAQIELYEGRLLEYEIRVEVKEPGLPILWIEGLPAGATFDSETRILKWIPGYFDGNDPKDPTIKRRSYPITIWLRSTLNDIDKIKAEVILNVNDSPRPININGSSTARVNEGETLSYEFDIKDQDYPDGPFTVTTDSMPSNTKLVKVDEKTYKLVFSPDYYHVNLKDNGTNVRYTSKITVHNPAKHLADKTVDFTVYDKRLGVNVQTPNTAETPILEQGLDASFQIAAYDLNLEVTPEISLTSNKPGFGKFAVSLTENEDSFSSVLNVKWTDIPPQYNGEIVEVGYKACVLSSQYSSNNCSNGVVKLQVVVKDRKAPIISRDYWSQGELIYLGFNKSETRRLKITDGEDTRLKPTVEIFPEEMRQYVKWGNDSITLKFDKSGVFQFSVKATSPYKTSTTESFIVEVFPQDRSKFLFFADSTRDPEVKFYKEILPSLSLMNPYIQQINARNISDRETLIIGTSMLFDKEASGTILAAMKEVKNIVVASPLIDNMPEEFLTELQEKYNMDFIGRYTDLPRTPEIEKTYFAHTSQFQAPQDKVRLNLKASTESWNPLIFNGGLDEPNKDCKGVLGLTDNGNNPYVIGVVCQRTNGGRLVLLGTEWADLKVIDADKAVPGAWFNTMLSGRF